MVLFLVKKQMTTIEWSGNVIVINKTISSLRDKKINRNYDMIICAKRCPRSEVGDLTPDDFFFVFNWGRQNKKQNEYHRTWTKNDKELSN